tara:strand:- start:154 stop:630 length:477 start_codon:yes stop_codon:yes gene_type:complete
MGTLNTANINLTGNLAAPNKPTFAVYLNGNQSISNATDTKVLFNAEDFDVGNNFDTSNGRFTAPIAGKYVFMGHLYIYSTRQVESRIYKNGSIYKRFSGPMGTGFDDNPNGMDFMDLIDLDVNDYVEIYGRHTRYDDNFSQNIYGGSIRETSFVGYLI